jgi:hypothetical protein
MPFWLKAWPPHWFCEVSATAILIYYKLTRSQTCKLYIHDLCIPHINFHFLC